MPLGAPHEWTIAPLLGSGEKDGEEVSVVGVGITDLPVMVVADSADYGEAEAVTVCGGAIP